MPIIRTGAQLIYYAHVPKCGGSAVIDYITHRFGTPAFEDEFFHYMPEAKRWSKTSPQHVDLETLNRLFPPGFFDHAFSIVRHPVARMVSAYHFQLEVEKKIPETLGFGSWLGMLEDKRREDPYVYDNHTRPMCELVPEGARIFHLEHGLDAIIPWFDHVTGATAGGRAIHRVNTRGEYVKVQTRKAVPTSADIEAIEHLYSGDFKRFGYVPGEREPRMEAPVLSQDMIRARDAEIETYQRPLERFKRRLRGKGLLPGHKKKRT